MPPSPDADAVSVPSFWQAIAPPALRRPPLTGTVDTELAIVGGGIAGLSLALQLAQAGRAVALVEAAMPGSGAIGASAGIVAPQLVRTTPDRLLARLGREVGSGWLRLIGESGGHLFDLIRTHAIDCDARPYGFIAPSRAPGATDRLAEVVEQWRPFRQDLSVLPAAEVAGMTGTRGYTAAILDASGGGVDPLRLVHGLARRSAEAGAELYYHSPAQSLTRTNGKWVLATPGGTVTARRVVLCANGGNHRLHPALHDSVLPMRVHELVTTPLSAAMRATLLPQGHALTDLELDIFSIRLIEGGRLLTYCPAAEGATIRSVERAVNQRLQQMLSYHEPLDIAYLWDGVAWMNSSLLPRVVDLNDGLLAVQACNGRGIATNAIVGREVARMLLDPQGYRSSITLAKPRAIRGFALARHLPNVLLRGARMIARWKSAIP